MDTEHATGHETRAEYPPDPDGQALDASSHNESPPAGNLRHARRQLAVGRYVSPTRPEPQTPEQAPQQAPPQKDAPQHHEETRAPEAPDQSLAAPEDEPADSTAPPEGPCATSGVGPFRTVPSGKLRRYAASAAAGLVLVAFGAVAQGALSGTLGGSGDELVDGSQGGTNTGTPASEVPGDEPQAPNPEQTRDTGVVFGGLEVGEDDEVFLSAGEDMSWEGTFAAGEDTDGEDPPEDLSTAGYITLGGEEAPSSGTFQRNFEVPGATVQTGGFTVNRPGEPVVHGLLHRTEPTGDGTEETQGSYVVAQNGAVTTRGTYTDSRTGEGDQVLRTYYEPGAEPGEQRTFSVHFEAPPGTPIPYLVGWEPEE